MQIYVVRQNDTLSGIARSFGTTAEDIAEANELPNPNNLVVGQALVIPIIGSFYWVQSGDNLWSISRRFQVSYQQLAAANRIPVNQPLQIGFRLYIPQRPRTRGEFNAYVEPRGTSVSPVLENSARDAAPYLTYLAPFSFQALRDGSLKEPLLNNFPAIAQANNNVLMMVITNQENDQFSDELGRILLNDLTIQDRFLNNIVTTAKKYGFRDIHFDFEHLRPQTEKHIINFYEKPRPALKERDGSYPLH